MDPGRQGRSPCHTGGLSTPPAREGEAVKRTVSFAAAVLPAAAAVAAAVWLAAPAGAAPARPAVSGTESIQLMTTSAAASTRSAIATGLFTAGGVDHAGPTVDTIVFPQGSYKVAHAKATGPATLNPKTCLLTVSQHGTFRAFDGTGMFAGIRGHGTYHVSILAVLARSGGTCTQAKPPLAYQQIINGLPAKVTL
jgi:hypothetical protein